MSKRPKHKKAQKPKEGNDEETHEENLGEFIKRLEEKIDKPCKNLEYCPYGPLVEQFPLLEFDDPKRCVVFGHICPVFLVAEPFMDSNS